MKSREEKALDKNRIDALNALRCRLLFERMYFNPTLKMQSLHCIVKNYYFQALLAKSISIQLTKSKGCLCFNAIEIN